MRRQAIGHVLEVELCTRCPISFKIHRKRAAFASSAAILEGGMKFAGLETHQLALLRQIASGWELRFFFEEAGFEGPKMPHQRGSRVWLQKAYAPSFGAQRYMPCPSLNKKGGKEP